MARIISTIDWREYVDLGISLFSRNLKADNARVNRDAATRTEVCLVESDIMGGTTIRRLIGHKDFTASVQRFVIHRAK